MRLFLKFLLRGALLSYCVVGPSQLANAERAPDPMAAKAVAKTYADIAHASYEDSLVSARALRGAIARLTIEPTPESLSSARAAWIAARVPYQQTEVFRFGNSIVDDWEGKVNAWPLDEGLIDYVAGDYGKTSDENDLYTANVIANTSLKINGKALDTSRITTSLLADQLQEAGGIEANVATGYHAIEFLLWGQDLNGTKAGAGQRPASDFDLLNCTGGNCERRIAYLKAATELLIEDLAWMVRQWAPGGDARFGLEAATPDVIARTIFTGMGSLSYGELAGERMKLGLMLHDPEEEHDCFSDNTHNSHYYDALGIQNVYLGTYTRIDGRVVSGPGITQLVAGSASKTDAALRAALATTMSRMKALVARAEKTEAYDQMIAEGNVEGNRVVQAAIDALLIQTKAIERAVAAIDTKALPIEGSDSLDNPDAVKTD